MIRNLFIFLCINFFLVSKLKKIERITNSCIIFNLVDMMNLYE